ncbi:type I-E CRISPR-associated protein Cse2/CasB [Limobrevibacterium gyesilva]|uniref:Type I-E CRISPR-associated protein Cse2/CasB n=1 Tax=Limobrevibacterium gyesilva TaxID=2991712 RepID=A0AA41YUS8_9PROT|nr:type I-E CRISPR-associated protein Cse2/CasB [Limobrevibacterium gyesilva]MCW3476875.1 type I-E CRISPR-associated protein Cse2/CasB [Limobrevibacterium gyesilva]
MSPKTGPIAAAWWRDLQPCDEAGKPRRGDRAALARLRRCATVMEAAGEPAAIALCRRLGGTECDLGRAALIAAVLAHVRDNVGGLPVARQVGVQQDGKAAISDLRFRRLLQADTDDEQLIGFRRLVALAGHKLNVADLAASLWRWNDKQRRRWIYAYHEAPDFGTTADITANDADAVAFASEDASA